RDCVELTRELQGVRPVTVLDREGDVFALFAERERLGHVDLLVRAKHNRALAGGSSKLFDELRQAPLQATLEFDVGRQSARRSTQRQKKREAQPGRKAKVELRFGTVRLPAPDEDCPTLSVQAVHVREREPPKSGKRVEWLLLTTCPVRRREDAERVLQWYRLRWRIEDWHRVLKTGCKVEHLQHHTGERIERAVTISAVIAWRLMLMTLLGRQTPELPAEVLFTETELMVLRDFARERKLPEPTNLGGAVRTMARMAGHLDRKGDAPPGHQKMWEGHADLSAAARAYGRILRLQQESLLVRKLSADG
ncbi:MAG: IS4 family transposase, partial [Bryobacterales bacterium]|nr:IS4 family transposase [Bryobacterales bacterium]